jgi:hypothetical protein
MGVSAPSEPTQPPPTNPYTASQPALNAILQLTPLKHFIVFHTNTIKQRIADFNKLTSDHNLHITNHAHDVKDFYNGIHLHEMSVKLQDTFDMYKSRHHAIHISIPKHKNSGLSVIPKRTHLTSHYSIHLPTLYSILLFAFHNAYFSLGSHFLRQTLGLSMGCPTSPPLANLYLAHDEHYNSSLHTISLSSPVPGIILIFRYMDDINTLIATPSPSSTLHSSIPELIKSNLYDTTHKNLSLKTQPDTNFLDCTIIIHNNSHNVKIIYNNKNSRCLYTDVQDIGRFHHASSPSPISQKIAAAQTIFVKIFDFTTSPIDMTLPSLALCRELTLLDYHQHHIISAITKASRTRPIPFWKTFVDIVYPPCP